MIQSLSIWQKRLIFSFKLSFNIFFVLIISRSGDIPNDLRVAIDCCVGFVFGSPLFMIILT